MPTIEQSKINYLHKKVVDRYSSSPTSDDEDMIMIFDTQNPKPEGVYASMGYSEHPVFQRNNWVNEVAANMTDAGYWSWVGDKINKGSKYRYDGSTFRDTRHSATGIQIEATFPAPVPERPRYTEYERVAGQIEESGFLPYTMAASTDLQP